MSFQHPHTETALAFLIEAASEGRTVHAGDVAVAIGWDRRAAQGIGPILREIYAEDLRVGRPTLVAIVLRTDSGLPPGGHFREVYGFEPEVRSNDAVIDLPPEVRAAWEANVQQVFAYWRRQLKQEEAPTGEMLDMAAEAIAIEMKNMPRQLGSFTFEKYGLRITVERI